MLLGELPDLEETASGKDRRVFRRQYGRWHEWPESSIPGSGSIHRFRRPSSSLIKAGCDPAPAVA